MTTEQRLEWLQRENRWMRRIGAVGVAVVAAVFLIRAGGSEGQGAAGLGGPVAAGRGQERPKLNFADDTSRTRVSLQTAHFRFIDATGRNRVMIGLLPGEPYVWVNAAVGGVAPTTSQVSRGCPRPT